MGLIDIVRVLEKVGFVDVPYLENELEAEGKTEVIKEKVVERYARSLPSVRYFFGRESEMSEISSAFTDGYRFVVVYGLAGIGKTTLAAKYVEKNVSPDNVFWHRFYSWDDVRSFLLELGEYLEDRGIPDVCNIIKERRNVFPLLAHPLMKKLAKTEVFFVLDDFHIASDDIVELMVMIKNEANRLKGAKFLILSREHKPFYDVRDTVLSKKIWEMKLSGLDEDSILKLYKAVSDENVSKEDILSLMEVSKGHPLAVELIGARRISGGDFESLLDMDEFLENEIFSKLTDPEKNLLLFMSVARIPLDVDCLLLEKTLRRKKENIVLVPLTHEVLFDGNALSSLLLKHLVLREGKNLFAHDIVCEFFSKWPSLKIKRAVHRKWASYIFTSLQSKMAAHPPLEQGEKGDMDFLTKDDENIFLALFHHLKEANEIRLLGPVVLRFKKIFPIVFRQEELVQIFEGDYLDDLSGSDRGVIFALLGDLHYQIGNMDAAIANYYRSLTDVFYDMIEEEKRDEHGKEKPRKEDIRSVVIGIVDIFSSIKQHPRCLNIEDIRNSLTIGLKTGRLLMKKGRWHETKRLFKEGMKLADQYEIIEIKADYLAAIGWIHHHLGDIERSRKYYDDCLDTLIDHHDIPGAIRKNLALGRACARKRDLEKAIVYFDVCMNYFEKVDVAQPPGEGIAHIGDHYLKMLFSTYLGE